MANIIVELSKYILVVCIILYTYQCFSVFGYHDYDKKQRILNRQRNLMLVIHFICFLVIYTSTNELNMLIFYAVQGVILIVINLLYTFVYPKVSRLVVNNMCMLISIGFVMLARLSFNKAVKQCVFVSGCFAASLFVPLIIRKVKMLSQWRIFYGVVGIVSLAAVLVAAQVSDGAKLGFTFGGISIQPSELVKIIFVFFVAASFYKSVSFTNVVITTALAAFHVLILVISKDLGAALIIFVVYLIMLYVATRQPLYMLAGLGAGSVASVAAYHLFSHVRTRVLVWKDPFAVYQNGGFQVAQSLFAIGTGSWFGMGLFQGAPNEIPVAEEDFIFSAISEELGLIFALCLILICLSCYVMFLNIAMQLRDLFYKLVALGLGTCYIFQVFLTIGGVTKFIPSTGVTLPFISYGGSSVLSTMIMFAVIQGLYILREDEEENLEREKAKQLREEKRISKPAKRRQAPADKEKRPLEQPKRRVQSKPRPRSVDEEIGATVQEALREKEREERAQKEKYQ